MAGNRCRVAGVGLEAVVSAFAVVVIGFIIGFLGRRFTGGRAPEIFLTSTLLGICGAVSATFLGVALGWDPGNAGLFLGAAIGAATTVSCYHLVSEQLG
jgi:uncharacterized membrane protein YeaQ/YmgE (transglycosylase-associated protein family)